MGNWDLLWEHISRVAKCNFENSCPYAQVVHHNKYMQPVSNVVLLDWIQQGDEFPCGVVFGERPCLVRSDSDADTLFEGTNNESYVSGDWTNYLWDGTNKPLMTEDAIERVRRIIRGLQTEEMR
jgi:hypothetical protein